MAIMRNDDLYYIQTIEEVPAFWWREYATIWLDKTRYEKEEVLLFHACLKKFFLKCDTKSIRRRNEDLHKILIHMVCQIISCDVTHRTIAPLNRCAHTISCERGNIITYNQRGSIIMMLVFTTSVVQ